MNLERYCKFKNLETGFGVAGNRSQLWSAQLENFISGQMEQRETGKLPINVVGSGT